MASLFKRAALAFGRFTGRRTRPETDLAQMPLIEPVAADESSPSVDGPESMTVAKLPAICRLPFRADATAA